LGSSATGQLVTRARASRYARPVSRWERAGAPFRFSNEVVTTCGSPSGVAGRDDVRTLGASPPLTKPPCCSHGPVVACGSREAAGGGDKRDARIGSSGSCASSSGAVGLSSRGHATGLWFFESAYDFSSSPRSCSSPIQALGSVQVGQGPFFNARKHLAGV